MKKKNLIILGGLLVIIVVGAYLFGSGTQSEFGAAPEGIPSDFATTGTAAVGKQAPRIIFNASNNCTARAVGTDANPIFIQFTSSAVASSTLLGATEGQGFPVAASSSATFDASIFGCGVWTAKSAIASTSISVQEWR